MKTLVFLFALAAFGTTLFAVDDIETIRNGKTPAGTPMTFELVEDLRLGPDMGDEYIWPSTAITVDADDEGRIYVMDLDGKRVMQYASDGSFLRQIGGPGQGPGEFMNLGGWQILADGRGVAFEPMGLSSSMSIFDKDMNFLEKKQLKCSHPIIQQAVFAPDGKNAMLLGVKPEGVMLNIQWMLVDLETGQEVPISGFQMGTPNQETFTNPDKFTDFLADSFQQIAKGIAGFAAFSPNGRIYTAVSKKYEIHSFNQNLKEHGTIVRDYKPIPQSEEEIMASVDTVVEAMKASIPPQVHHLVSKSGVTTAIAKAGFPPVKYPINGLNTLDDGSVLVIHEIDLLDKHVLIDIFDKNGNFLGNYKHAIEGLMDMAFAAKFKNGYMYRIAPTADDENQLVRYKYRLVPADKS